MTFYVFFRQPEGEKMAEETGKKGKKMGVLIKSRLFGAVVSVDPDRLKKAEEFHSQEWRPESVSNCGCSCCRPQGDYESKTRVAPNGNPVGYPPAAVQLD